MSRDLDLLQGSWAVTALEMDGQAMPAAMLGDARIVVKGDRFTSTGMGADYAGTLALNTATKPARFDLQFDTGPEKGNTNPGIYRLDGDTWKLCLATRGKVRPKSFKSPAGSGFAVETLQRQTVTGSRKAKVPKAAAPTGPATEFEGEWKMVSAVMDGKPMAASMVEWVKRITKGNQTTVMAGPQIMLKVEFTFDSSKSPQTIDYINLAGAHKGKSQQGIYKIEGDVLTVCIAPPGAARPGKFESAGRDGRTLTVWQRA